MAILSRRTMGRQQRGTDRIHVLNGSVLANSLRLAKCSVTAIDTIIASTLTELCRLEGADQAGWFSALEGSPLVVHDTSTATDSVIYQVGKLRELPWAKARLLEGRAVLISSLAELPSQAMIDRKFCEGLGLHSLALVPVGRKDLNSGFFALLSHRRTCHWSGSLTQQCAFLGSMFLSAYARKQASLERENSKSHFHELFRSASEGMALEDSSGHMLFVNEALCRMLGFTEPEMMRMTCKDFSHPADYEREAALATQLLNGEHNSYQIEKRFLHRNGGVVWCRVNVTLLQDYSNGSRVIAGVVEDITAQKEALEKLTISQKEVQSLASRLILSQEEERRRIARELHDDIGQRLSMVTSAMHVFEDSLGKKDPAQVSSIASLAETLDTLVSDVHGLSHRLHSPKLQHLGVASALRDLCGQITRAGLGVAIALDENLEPVPKDIAFCLYRVAQEALTNALRHSGVSQATINLRKTADEYYMVIADAGKGFDMEMAGQGLGLISMRERVRSVGGYLSVTANSGRGTQIAVGIPWGNRLGSAYEETDFV